MSKACRYAFGIIIDHPFVNGNKRTGTALVATYLKLSGIGFAPDHKALLDTMFGVADGSLKFEELVSWTHLIVKLR